jgi:hypothetical protein
VPTFRVTVQETRVYEYDAASEADARAAFEDDLAEPPVGSERSVSRAEIAVERLSDPTPHIALSGSRAPDPSSEPTIPPPRAL